MHQPTHDKVSQQRLSALGLWWRALVWACLPLGVVAMATSGWADHPVLKPALLLLLVPTVLATQAGLSHAGALLVSYAFYVTLLASVLWVRIRRARG